MTGTIADINRDKGIIAIETNMGHTVIQYPDADQLEVGDELEWSLDGQSRFKNLTKGRTFIAVFKNHGVQKSQLPQQLQRVA